MGEEEVDWWRDNGEIYGKFSLCFLEKKKFREKAGAWKNK
jgi:hypothetical protein